MSIRSLVTLDETLLAALTHGTVVVPSRRLQHATANAFDQHQMTQGRVAWRAAQVHTLESHLETIYQRASAPHSGPLRLLQAPSELLLWLRTAPAEAGDHPEVLIDDIAEAWRLAHAWKLWGSIEGSARNESHRVFVSWAARFQQALIERRAITTAELPAWLTQALRADSHWVPTRLLTYGFEQTPVAITELWRAYRAAGCDLHHAHDSATASPVSATAVVYPTVDSELRAAARWARGVIETARADGADHDMRVGIAIPDLVQRHAALTRQLDATFTPTLAHARPGSAIYNLAGGTPLSEQPIARDAIDLLVFATSPLHFREVHRLLRSPSAGILCDALDLLSERLPERFDLATFARMSGAESARQLHEHVARWPLRASIAEWVAHLREYLRITRWAQPERLQAGGIEVRNAVDDVLRRLCDDGLLEIPWTARELVVHLHRMLVRTMFAPRRPDAPVQVLGYLETAGLRFTHLWVTGLDGTVWPSAPRPNPYLSSIALRAAAVPRSDVDSELAFAMASTARWLRSSPIVRFSCAKEHGEETRSPSPLIAGWRAATEGDLSAVDRPHPHFYATERTVRTTIDESPAPVEAVALRRRGSALLRDQHACPFLAFARSRLQVSEQQAPHTFPNAIDRGTLLHRVLELAGRAHIGRSLSTSGLQSFIDHALRDWARFPRRIRDAERTRLEHVIAAWLKVESTRTPYQIESVETEASVTVGGIPLRLRVDRIDRSTQGAIIIDYKTSNVGGTDIGASQPQLPLYALAFSDAVAVLYAQVRSDTVALRGVVASTDIQRTEEHMHVDCPETLGAASWEALLARWRQQLDELARTFLAGTASVAPRDPAVCRTCNLHALCRIRIASLADA